MSVFTTFLLVQFAAVLSYNFVRALQQEKFGLAFFNGLEAVAFAYLLKVLFH